MSSPSANLTLSKYIKHLDGVLKKRYIAKKSLLGIQDSYICKKKNPWLANLAVGGSWQNIRKSPLDYHRRWNANLVIYWKWAEGQPILHYLIKHVEHLDGVLRERHIAKSSLVGLQPQDPYNLPANLLTPIHLCQPEFQTSPTMIFKIIWWTDSHTSLEKP